MLLDKSYFQGPLALPQLEQKESVDNLNMFINRLEPIILQAALGYDLYQDFSEGINVGSDENIETKWLNILNGCAFTTLAGRKKKWVGFAGSSNTSITTTSLPQPLVITAGITPGFAINDNKFQSPALKSWNYALEHRGIGTMLPYVEWIAMTTGGPKMVDDNYQTQAGEVWIIHYLSKKVSVVSVSSQPNTQSPLAAIIFYEVVASGEFKITASGTVKTQTENADAANPAFALSAIWNQAGRDIEILWEYLQANASDYDSYDVTQIDKCFFKPINGFGI